MMTREEILAIDQYCQEHKVSIQKRLNELGIPFWRFYKAKHKYKLEDESSSGTGAFVQLPSGVFGPGNMPTRSTRRRTSASNEQSIQESYLTIEVRTPCGTAMRIQGNMTAAHLREIISAGNVQS